jgi:hypothetical protein
MKPPVRQQYPKRTLYAILLASFAAGAVSFVIPVVSSVENPFAAHLRAAMTNVITVAFTGAALWFMASLGHFTTRLRRAYVLLGVGLIVFSIAMLQLSIIGLLDQWDSEWATGGGVILLFTLGCVFAYAAMRSLARLVGLRGLLSSFLAVTGISVVTGGLFYLLATSLLTYELEGIDMYIGVVGATASYLLSSSLLTGRLAGTMGARYHQVMRWQTIAFSVFALGALHEAVTTIFFDPDHWYQAYGIYLWPFVVSGVLFVCASYEFRRLTTQEVAATASGGEPADQDYIDTLLAVAGLASNPKEIDEIMDELRSVTASLSKQPSMTSDQKRRLVNTYYQLEKYLTTKDPLRTFTTDEVREQVTPGFLSVFRAKRIE